MWWMSLEIGLAITNCAQQQLLLGYDYPICRRILLLYSAGNNDNNSSPTTTPFSEESVLQSIGNFSDILVTFWEAYGAAVAAAGASTGTLLLLRLGNGNPVLPSPSWTKGQRQQMVFIRDDE